MYRVATFICLLVLPLLTVAQDPHPILRSFSGIKQPNGILLKWVIKGGKQCDGTKVFRAEDSIEFEQIEHIEGICGSQAVDVTYSYFDNAPASNGYNRYKLEMGFQGFTDTVTVFFEDFGPDAYLLQTDQFAQNYKILFSNDLNTLARLEVYNLSGKLLYTNETLGNDFQLQSSDWRSGLYIFRISGVSEADISGKLYFSGQ